MNETIWDQTYRRDDIPRLHGVSVLTALSEHTPGQRALVAQLDITLNHDAFAVEVCATVKMAPAQMRALAELLRTHADRVEHELIPLLAPAPEIIPFQLYTEPEAA